MKANFSKYISFLEIVIFHILECFKLKNESANQSSDGWKVVFPGEFISLLVYTHICWFGISCMYIVLKDLYMYSEV